MKTFMLFSSWMWRVSLWEDQQMMWGPTGGTGGLILNSREHGREFAFTSAHTSLRHLYSCQMSQIESSFLLSNFNILMCFKEAVNLVCSTSPRTWLLPSELSSVSQWCLIRTWLAPWVETTCESIRCEVHFQGLSQLSAAIHAPLVLAVDIHMYLMRFVSPHICLV